MNERNPNFLLVLLSLALGIMGTLYFTGIWQPTRAAQAQSIPVAVNTMVPVYTIEAVIAPVQSTATQWVQPTFPPTWTPIPVSTETQPAALVGYKLCKDAPIFSTTSVADEYLLGYLPKDTDVFITHQSSDGQFAKLYTQGLSVEWWMPVSFICQ
jgi:hypothetical protein